jgi:hypothetical protein
MAAPALGGAIDGLVVIRDQFGESLFIAITIRLKQR